MAGGEVISRRRRCSPEADPGEIPGEVRVVRGYKGLGRLPGTTANLLRGLWKLAVQRSGVLTAEPGRGETEQRGGGGARVCGEAAADEGAGRGHGGQIKPEPRDFGSGVTEGDTGDHGRGCRADVALRGVGEEEAARWARLVSEMRCGAG